MEDKIPQNPENNEIDFVDIEEQIEQTDTKNSDVFTEIQVNKDKDLKREDKINLQEKVFLLQKDVNKKEKERQKAHDRYLRALADYENLIKRTKAERAQLLKNANETLLSKFLNLADSFEKAKINFSDPSVNSNVLKEGFQVIEHQFLKLLKDEGVEKINCLGEKVDPAFHEAVFVRSEAGVGEGIILEEVQAGYLQNNNLLRPSKVIIAKNSNKGENKDA